MRRLRPLTVISCTQDQCFQKTSTVAAVCCHWGPQRKGGQLLASLSVTLIDTKQEKDTKHWGWLSQCIAAGTATGSGGRTLRSKSITNFSFQIFSIFPVTDKTVIFKGHIPIFLSDTVPPPSAPDGVDVLKWYLWTRFTLEVQNPIFLGRKSSPWLSIWLQEVFFIIGCSEELQSSQSFWCLCCQEKMIYQSPFSGNFSQTLMSADSLLFSHYVVPRFLKVLTYILYQ